MSEIICIRLLHESSKSEGLLTSIRAINEGRETPALFAVDSASFNEVPNAPFSYAIEERVRKLFKELPAFENAERTARVGLQTSDDFRFVRCWWEVGQQFCKDEPKLWIPFAKGGFYSPYYADLFLVINWKDNGKELKAFTGSVIRNDQYYGSPGLTWSEATTKEFGCRPLPAGCIYSHVGLGIFQDNESKLIGTQVILNSPQLRALMGISLGLADVGRRHYTAGTIQRLPIAVFDAAQLEALNDIGYRAWDAQRARDFNNEISHFYISPYGLCAPDKLDADQRKLDEQQIWRRGEVSKLEQRASELIAKVYGFTPVTPGAPPNEELADVEESRAGQSLEKALISYLIGLSFGRWKIVNDPEAAKSAYGDDPFAPLPPYAAAFNAAPGTNEQAVFLEGDSLYQSIRRELVGFFGEAKAASIEGQLCAMLSVESLDEYLHRPTGFFANHVSQYSESRRQAPIYWPISTKSGNFTIWVYYPKLDDQSLPKLIADVLSPKIRKLSQEIENRRATPGGKIGELEALRLELEEMRADFLDLINRGYRPNQNDGVLITACPLAKYFRHAGFRKNLEACWKDLARGDFDWAHLAMSMWPDRVVEVCKKDRSIAIAHGKEELCPAEPPTATRGRKKTAPSA